MRVKQICEKQQPLSCLTREALKGDVGMQAKQGKVVDILSDSEINSMSHESLAMRVAVLRDKRSFAILFSYFGPRLKSFLMRNNLNEELAEDMAQEALIAFWHKAGSYNADKAKFSTWLFRVARNKLIDHQRKHKYPLVNADDHMKDMVAEDKTDGLIKTKQNVNAIKTAMNTLNPAQRKVIELSFFEELSHTQIAEHLSLPLGTVKSRIRMAFTTLRNELGDYQ